MAVVQKPMSGARKAAIVMMALGEERSSKLFKYLQEEEIERIATNILADRLRKLEAHGLITTQPDAADGRKLTYLLTPKGIDLAPVLAEMVLWAARHEETGNQPLVRALQTNKQGVVTEVRDRWAQTKIHRAG